MSKESNIHAENLDRAVELAKQINLNQLQILMMIWQDRLNLFFAEEGRSFKIEDIHYNGADLQINIEDEFNKND